MKNKIVDTFKIKLICSNLSNIWHFNQKVKGSKIHKSDKYIIPRKKKYKSKIDAEWY